MEGWRQDPSIRSESFESWSTRVSYSKPRVQMVKGWRDTQEKELSKPSEPLDLRYGMRKIS